jgi:flagellar biosynthesis/type III secretory pathway protein FliH
MARTEVITDDLDGTHDAQPVQFGWDGVTWEIDLAEKNRKRLEEALQPFLEKAHPANVAQARSAQQTIRRTRQTGGAKRQVEYGMPHRGRVSPEEAAYVREHFDEVQKMRSDRGVPLLDPADPKVKERYGL